MSHFFGVSNHSPDQVISFLKKRNAVKSGSDVAIITHGTVFKADRSFKRKIIFIISVIDFFKNIEVLKAKGDDYQVFLFASPLRISEVLGMSALDFEPDNEYKGMSYRLTVLNEDLYRKDLKLPGSTEVKRDTRKYLATLINSAKQGSFLNPLMTFIYTLPRASHQTPVKEVVATGIYRGWTSDKVFEAIGAKGLVLTRRAADLLENIIQSEMAHAYVEAFKMYKAEKKKGATVNIKSICKQTSTSDYEMRYLLSVLEANKVV